ncbi:MAG: hypothetical protein ACRYG6_10380 [Janthinobacterium lividum]
MDLVPDRVCGACTVCCRELTIDDPALRKPAAVPCAHCVPSRGCAVHASRPATCREWHCGWRLLPWLDGALRPDLSGLLVLVEAGDAPGRGALVFNVVPAEAAAGARVLARQGSLDILGALVREDVPVFLGVKDAAGRHGARLPLNAALGTVARGRDGDAVRRAVLRIYKEGLDVVRRMATGTAVPPGPAAGGGAGNA